MESKPFESKPFESKPFERKSFTEIYNYTPEDIIGIFGEELFHMKI